MYRYTTPTIGIVFPQSVTASDITEFWVTMMQKKTEVLNKTKSAFTQDAQNERRFFCVLTEAETAKFTEDVPVKVQVRANIDGQSVASNIQVLDVSDVLKEGEIL